MKSLPVLAVLFMLVLAPACSAEKPAPGKSAAAPAAESLFSGLSLDQALARAKAEQKLVFVDFFAEWCGPCKMLDRTTWADPKVQALLKAKTIPVKVDVDKEPALAQKFQIEAMPTLMFLRADGSIARRELGYMPADDFLALATQVLGK